LFGFGYQLSCFFPYLHANPNLSGYISVYETPHFCLKTPILLFLAGGGKVLRIALAFTLHLPITAMIPPGHWKLVKMNDHEMNL